ncbi:MAG: class I SAM-dependent methyltransferase [Candidatus Dormibacteria bacterium]
MPGVHDGQVWSSGEGYNEYVGRWSRLVARQFLSWLEVPTGYAWLDVGCGTGALTEAILASSAPTTVLGIDPSRAFVEHASAAIRDPRTTFRVGSAESIEFGNGSFGAVVCGLVLNFVPDHGVALAEMRRVTTPGGFLGTYLWDYAEKMEMMRQFWDAAAELDPLAKVADEGARFPICGRKALGEAFSAAGLRDVEVRAIDTPTVFASFDDFWTPFLSGQAPAPAYNMALSEEKRSELRQLIRSRLPTSIDGSIHLVARAWAARGRC